MANKKSNMDTAFVINFYNTQSGKKLCKFEQYSETGKREVLIDGKKLIGFVRRDGNINVIKTLPYAETIDISDC